MTIAESGFLVNQESQENQENAKVCKKPGKKPGKQTSTRKKRKTEPGKLKFLPVYANNGT